MEDIDFLTKTFTGADTIYTMVPPYFGAADWKKPNPSAMYAWRMFQFRSCSGFFPEIAPVIMSRIPLSDSTGIPLSEAIKLAQWSSGSMDEIVKARMEYDSRLQ